MKFDSDDVLLKINLAINNATDNIANATTG